MFTRFAVFCLAAVLCTVPGLPVLANDSTASLETGDLVLIPNDDIRLADEDLYISRDEVRVRYVFENTSGHDVTTPVAFPLPAVEFGYDANYSVEAADPVNFVNFRLWVDGRPAAFQVDARATNADGQDITDLLARHGIPITTFTAGIPGFERLRARLDALPSDVMRELRAAGAIHAADWGDGFFEAWTAHVAFYWMQTFPASGRVTIEHRYAPVPSQTFFGPYDLESGTFRDAACIDADFAAAARRRMDRTEYRMLGATILDYILVTANNWRGPIGRFHLTVDKGSTDTLVSLCRDGIVKTGSTTFEWEGRDYRPERDLTVLFLSPLPTE
jgi:hypothetical protein